MLTVGELKKALATVSDDVLVVVEFDTDRDGAGSYRKGFALAYPSEICGEFVIDGSDDPLIAAGIRRIQAIADWKRTGVMP